MRSGQTSNKSFDFNKFKPGLNGDDSDLSDATFIKFRDFIYNKFGIYFNSTKKYLLASRLRKHIRNKKIASYEEYYNYLNTHRNNGELKQLANAITINETFFFRTKEQFEGLENIIIPELLKNRSRYNKILRIWSAASSTGDEAYTTALIINEKFKNKYPDINFQILASDIDDSAIEKAKKGVYTDYAIRNIPPEYMNYFEKLKDKYILSEEIRNMVEFKNINLYDEFSMKQQRNIDFIFCSNVLIYFDLPSKQKVVNMLYNSLKNGGYMYIGFSESLYGLEHKFKIIHLPKALAYKKQV